MRPILHIEHRRVGYSAHLTLCYTETRTSAAQAFPARAGKYLLHKHSCGGHTASARLRFALVLTAAILVVELAGGWMANSLALLSDAGHVFTDVIALGLAWFAARQAERPATGRKTYGFHRAGILAALANALTLFLISFFILWEAYKRLSEPEVVHSELMLGVAFIGLLANLIVVRYLQHNEGENLNVKSALLHVLGDALASVAVIVGGVIIMFTGWLPIDPLLSVLIALIIAAGSWPIIRQTVNILMEGAPDGLDVEDLVGEMRSIHGVLDVHDVHVWTLAAGLHALSGHVIVDDQALSSSDGILQCINQMLSCKYGINHSTLQFEHCECGETCALASRRAVSV